jgi:hypothetical protein
MTRGARAGDECESKSEHRLPDGVSVWRDQPKDSDALVGTLTGETPANDAVAFESPIPCAAGWLGAGAGQAPTVAACQ